MDSKFSIELGFDLPGRPSVIQIIQRDTPDTRDQLLKDFLEQLGGESNWCTIKVVQDTHHEQANRFRRYQILPITPDLLIDQALEMLKRAGCSIEPFRGDGKDQNHGFTFTLPWPATGKESKINSV